MLKAEYIALKDLKLHPKNPRLIKDASFEKLCTSIKDNPAYFEARPIIYSNRTGQNIIIAGNMRYRAAKHIGMKEVPAILFPDLTEEKEKEIMIRDNISNGEWDFDALANDGWDEILLADWGLELPEIEMLPGEEVPPDEDILEPPKNPKTKLGDVYVLGDHRLICGDSTAPDVVSLLLDKAEPILMVTDPPYGVNYDPNWRIGKGGVAGKHIKSAGKVKNDDQVNWALAWHLFTGSVAYIWHAGQHASEVQKGIEDANYQIVSQIIWIKQNHSLSRGDYQIQHEPCWYAVKKGHNHNWQGSRTESTTWEIASFSAFGGTKEEKTAHSTQKPIECMARPIRNNTAKGEGVYDPFAGSGTTLIAAEMLERKSYNIELDPAYCDIIVSRWVKYRRKKGEESKVVLNGNEIEWEI